MGIDPRRFKGSGQERAWLDWLGEETSALRIPERLRHRGRLAERQDKSVASKAPDTSHHTVAINLTLPRLNLGRIKEMAPQLPYKRLAIAGAIVVVLGSGVVAAMHFRKSDKPSTGVLAEVSTKQDFPTLLPEGGAPETTSSQVKYNAQHKVASYTDLIGGVHVTVSQQKLPEQFKASPDEQVKKMAEGFSANEVISTSTPTSYLGTSVKGPQTLIFHKNGVLVFIQSANKIDKEDWAEYVTKLK